MDILGMLQNDIDELCVEDIEMIEQELLVGNYTAEYKSQCKLYIMQFTRHFERKKKEKVYQSSESQEMSSKLIKNEEEVTVVTSTNPLIGEVTDGERHHEKTRTEIFRDELQKMREMSEPINRFLKYLEENDFVTNDFIDQNFNEFTVREKNELLRVRQFSEEFLDKYFDNLDKGMLVLNQLFSEEFFMKHYNDIPVKLVLTKSKNAWRKKEHRSKKLDSFLRLKGVRI